MLVSVSVGVWLGLAGYTFYYAHGASYLSNDPKACVNCHIMRDQFEGWQKSSHHAVATCNDCHVPHDLVGKYFSKAANGYHHSKAFTLQDFHEPIRIKPGNFRILQDNCLRCHEGLVADMVPHRGVMQDALDCVRCHNDTGHGVARSRWLADMRMKEFGHEDAW
jgi:cytochrome c nitrite reductase small subunit